MTRYEGVILAGIAVIVGLLSKILLSLNGESFSEKDLANAETFIELVRRVTNDND